MKIHRTILSAVVALVLCAGVDAAPRRPLTLDDMFSIKRISSPALSPDGRWVVYTVTTADTQANKTTTDLWLTSTDGRSTRQLTDDPAHDRNAVWSPDGKWIAFESTRSGDSQIWLITPGGKEPRQLTHISTEAEQIAWSPDGSKIAFVSEVFPENAEKPFAVSDSLNRQALSRLASGPVRAKVFTHLLYREWVSWRDGRRKHIFVQPVAGGDPLDLTPGDRDAVPFSMTFSEGADYAFSPDGKEIAYTATPVPVREEAWRTNHDIYTVPVTGGAPRQITTNPAADGAPRYSPDGKYIAYRAQSVPGFEADRWQLMLYDRAAGTHRSLSAQLDLHVGSPVWSPDSRGLYSAIEEIGEEHIFAFSLGGDVVHVTEPRRNAVTGAGCYSELAVTPDGTTIVCLRSTATHPADIFRLPARGKGDAEPVTNANEWLFSQRDIPPPTVLSFAGAGNTRIRTMVFVPPGFDSTKQYPMVYYVHGGPQGAWKDSWSYRWNPALWAAQGYIIVAPNPRGSTGYGQEFINEITGDWGGKVFEDLMKGLDFAESFRFVDRTRVGAAGASFGGYMMNWFQGNAPGKFKTLVTHDGVYNFDSMYGTTEEVWFDEWEHGGPPWVNRESYEKFSPHMYAKNFSTPNLIIHGGKDFRVPESEGFQLFTALQRQGIPSKFLYFPDEGHWVLKPGNSRLWHQTVFAWLAEYLHPQSPMP